MKKVILAIVLFVGVSTAAMYAWNPGYLATYPKCTKGGDWQINLGIGLPSLESGHTLYIPPVRLTFDKNTPLGKGKLPFFFGGLLTFSASKIKANDHIVSNINAGFRFGYHFNWDVDRLDTYIVSNVGVGLKIANNKLEGNDAFWPAIGTNIGARWYVSDSFGFWAEGGFGFHDLTPNVNIGFAFKW